MYSSKFGYKYSQDDFRDNRSLNKANSDYSKGMKNEKTVMSAMVTQAFLKGAKLDQIGYERVEKNEALNDPSNNRIHIEPDYFFFVKDKTFTFEIKCNTTGNYVEEEDGKFIWVKAGAIISMIKNPKLYPNGHLLAVNERTYAIMPAAKVGKYPLKVLEKFSTETKKKKGFFVPIEDLEWKPWNTPISLS